MAKSMSQSEIQAAGAEVSSWPFGSSAKKIGSATHKPINRHFAAISAAGLTIETNDWPGEIFLLDAKSGQKFATSPLSSFAWLGDPEARGQHAKEDRWLGRWMAKAVQQCPPALAIFVANTAREEAAALAESTPPAAQPTTARRAMRI